MALGMPTTLTRLGAGALHLSPQYSRDAVGSDARDLWRFFWVELRQLSTHSADATHVPGTVFFRSKKKLAESPRTQRMRLGLEQVEF